MTIAYDALGRRIISTDLTGASNPDGQCGTQPQPVSTRHVYAGIQAIEEYICCSDDADECDTEDWSLAREFVWGERFPEPVALIDHTDAGDEDAATPEILHYLHDVLGSSIVLTDGTGLAVERYSYDPYGKTVIETGDRAGVRPVSHYGNPFCWTGQRYDPSVQLYHFLFRSYSIGQGRWMQRDPLGYVDGVNLLECVASAPLTLVDPVGLMAWIPVPGLPFPLPWPPGITEGWKWDPVTRMFTDLSGRTWWWHKEDKWHRPHWDRTNLDGRKDRINPKTGMPDDDYALKPGKKPPVNLPAATPRPRPPRIIKFLGRGSCFFDIFGMTIECFFPEPDPYEELMNRYRDHPCGTLPA